MNNETCKVPIVCLKRLGFFSIFSIFLTVSDIAKESNMFHQAFLKTGFANQMMGFRASMTGLDASTPCCWEAWT